MMTGLTLEIGKFYLSAKSYDSLTGNRIPVKIVGKVKDDLDIQSYRLGDRFFDDTGRQYTAEGSFNKALYPKGNSSTAVEKRKILEPYVLFTEATYKEIQNKRDLRYIQDLEVCNHSDEWIRHDDASFIVKVGNVYVNRMGFLILIDSVRHSLGKNQDTDKPAVMGDFPYYPDGRVLPNQQNTMQDLIFQRVR